ncbi:hypothetical protein NQ318_012082, partial [Aromia moschata]
AVLCVLAVSIVCLCESSRMLLPSHITSWTNSFSASSKVTNLTLPRRLTRQDYDVQQLLYQQGVRTSFDDEDVFDMNDFFGLRICSRISVLTPTMGRDKHNKSTYFGCSSVSRKHSDDRVRCVEWARKLASLSDDDLEACKLKNEYVQLLRIQVRNKFLHGPFYL